MHLVGGPGSHTEHPDRVCWRLLARPSVDAFTQRVGVVGMAGILFDHVRHRLARADDALLVGAGHLGVRRIIDEACLLPSCSPGRFG